MAATQWKDFFHIVEMEVPEVAEIRLDQATATIAPGRLYNSMPLYCLPKHREQFSRGFHLTRISLLFLKTDL